jgi:nucleotide-binding universal stress UspA family protein
MKAFSADLVVAGSRDHGTFLEKLFGSKTQRIIHKTDFPMIILKDNGSASQVNKIALALDVNEKEQKGLDDIIGFAKQTNARLHMVHVITEDDEITAEEAIERLRLIADERQLSNHTINVINNSSLEEGLRHFIRKHNPEMVALLTQGKGKLKKLIYGSDTEEILRETDRPVLINKMA